DLAVHDPADLQVEAVRAEVDGGERIVACHSRHHSRIRELRLVHDRHIPATSFGHNLAGKSTMESETTDPSTMGSELPASFAGRAPAMNRRIPTPAQFLNRELGLLAFNRRVLAQAADDSVPLLERLRFITIVSSNLDEFFEIRVAGLKETVKLGLSEAGP